MTYQPKVNNTEQYSDSQGKHIVHLGKLLLLKNETPPADVYVKGIYGRHPIIISETEEIEEGEVAYHISTKTLDTFENALDKRVSDGFHFHNKILALPEHFSDKHLQAIVGGKMKDGDEVLVKCENRDYKEWRKDRIHRQFQIHLDQQNHITLFPVKRSLEQAYHDYYGSKVEHSTITHDAYDMVSFAEWVKRNNY
jgi:hypothetical protein